MKRPLSLPAFAERDLTSLCSASARQRSGPASDVGLATRFPRICPLLAPSEAPPRGEAALPRSSLALQTRGRHVGARRRG